MLRAITAILTTATVLGALCVPATAASAAPVDQNCTAAGTDSTDLSWAQQQLAADRVWPFSRGGNVTVAVLSSGVDANQPQLRGRVSAGTDATANGTADTDCVGDGTQVAGVIAAQQAPPAKFAGVAPQAGIVPVRVTARTTGGTPMTDAATLAKGITWALGQHVDVICVAVPAYDPAPDLLQAIRAAATQGVVVVAATGDRAQDSKGGNPTPYPAAYPGVVAVSALASSGSRWPDSGYGPFVWVSAPGAGVLTLQRSHGLTVTDGTDLAAGLVSGAVALLISRERAQGRTIRPDQVRARLAATATPAPAAPPNSEYGYGIVNPYRLLTESATTAGPERLPALQPSPLSPAEQERRAAWTRSESVALWLTLAVVVAVAVVLGLGAALPRGRRRRWQPTLARPPQPRDEPEEPGPPAMLFDEQETPAHRM